jgi:hypothetical protein
MDKQQMVLGNWYWIENPLNGMPHMVKLVNIKEESPLIDGPPALYTFYDGNQNYALYGGFWDCLKEASESLGAKYSDRISKAEKEIAHCQNKLQKLSTFQ